MQCKQNGLGNEDQNPKCMVATDVCLLVSGLHSPSVGNSLIRIHIVSQLINRLEILKGVLRISLILLAFFPFLYL